MDTHQSDTSQFDAVTAQPGYGVVPTPAGSVENIISVPLRPVSAIRWRTGVAGLIAVLASLRCVVRSDLDPVLAALIVMMAGMGSAIVLDGAPKVIHAWRHVPHRWSLSRVTIKTVGLAANIMVFAGAFAVFPFFRRSEFTILLTIPPLWIAIFAPLAILYLAMTDCLSSDKEDGLFAFGAFILGRPADADALSRFLVTQAIKLFFFTLMLFFFTQDIMFFRNAEVPASPFGTPDNFEWFNRLIFMVDVALAGLGYLATFKLFGWEVREPERTAFGWIACVICYDPLFPAVERAFLNYRSADAAGILPQGTVVQALWVVLILGSNLIYVLATVAFGPTFSNLTRRSIITSGPYRFTKHPAYVAKNFGWWIYELPSLLSDSMLGMVSRGIKLACINGIYLARARCEERLLAHDPVYVDYSAYIESRGVFAHAKRFLRLALKMPAKNITPDKTSS